MDQAETSLDMINSFMKEGRPAWRLGEVKQAKVYDSFATPMSPMAHHRAHQKEHKKQVDKKVHKKSKKDEKNLQKKFTGLVEKLKFSFDEDNEHVMLDYRQKGGSKKSKNGLLGRHTPRQN